MRLKLWFIYAVLLPGILLSSCRTANETLEHWDYTQGRTSLSLHVDDKNQAVLTLPFDFKAEVHGEAFIEHSGDWIFFTDELHLFYNWHNGWTESVISLQGILKVRRHNKSEWRMDIIEMPQILSLTEAQIRYKRDRIYGDRARDMSSRRLNRSLALAEIIPDFPDVEKESFQDKKKGYYSRQYVRNLKTFLFPERFGFNPGFEEPDSPLNNKERYIKNEEVRWDKVYSQIYFPDEFQDIRNSGTLYRDFEEASQLILICAQWENLWTDYITQKDIQEQ